MTDSNTNYVHYLLHRAVVRDERETTKVCVVFDTLAKYKGFTSLNKLLDPGLCHTFLISLLDSDWEKMSLENVSVKHHILYNCGNRMIKIHGFVIVLLKHTARLFMYRLSVVMALM